jgi:hypothetical protein
MPHTETGKRVELWGRARVWLWVTAPALILRVYYCTYFVVGLIATRLSSKHIPPLKSNPVLGGFDNNGRVLSHVPRSHPFPHIRPQYRTSGIHAAYIQVPDPTRSRARASRHLYTKPDHAPINRTNPLFGKLPWTETRSRPSLGKLPSRLAA